jgi:hypothetical protein
MDADAAGVVAQIFGAELVALLVEDRAVHRDDEDEFFFAWVFMLGLVSAGIGLFVSLPVVVWERAGSTAGTVAVAVCLTGSLFALVVPAAHRLPAWGLPRTWDTTLKSVITVVLVWIVGWVVIYA